MAFLVTKSIRSKLLALLAVVALAVTIIAVLNDLRSGETQIGREIAKRGRYVASSLALGAQYGVLVEDRALLQKSLEAGVAAAGGAQGGSEIVGAMIRDANGNTLAEIGPKIRDLPEKPPTRVEERKANTADGQLAIWGVPIDATYGWDGQPYRLELWTGGQMRASDGNIFAGQPSFRIMPGQDVHTSWSCGG